MVATPAGDFEAGIAWSSYLTKSVLLLGGGVRILGGSAEMTRSEMLRYRRTPLREQRVLADTRGSQVAWQVRCSEDLHVRIGWRRQAIDALGVLQSRTLEQVPHRPRISSEEGLPRSFINKHALRLPNGTDLQGIVARNRKVFENLDQLVRRVIWELNRVRDARPKSGI